MKKESKQIYDFTKLSVETEFDVFDEIDVSKVIGNTIHKGVSDIGLDDIARKIYHDGKVEISSAEAESIQKIIINSNLIVAVKQAVSKLLTNKK